MTRDSGAGRGETKEAEDQDPDARILELHRRDTEQPDGRWFLPLGGALRDQGRPEEAAAALRRGLARDPECLGAWVILGQCYAAMGETEVARSLFESIASRDCENSIVLRGLGGILARRGDRRRAADCYRALLKVMPRDLGAQEALAGLLEFSPEEGEGQPVNKAVEEEVAVEDDSSEAGKERASGEKAPAAERKAKNQMAKPWVRRPEPRRRSTPGPIVRASRGVGGLPPESRPKPGIFEPPPADLDWGEPRPAHGSALRSGNSAGAARGGYWRWLERIAAEEEGGRSDSSPRVGKE